MSVESPFPGMDPYLEQFWGDVHHGLITYARDQLQNELPDDLRARMEERVFVELESGESRTIFPDVHVVQYPSRAAASRATAAESDVAVQDMVLIPLHHEPITQGYIEIVDVGSGNRVVTVIEFLSPANKIPGSGQDLYLRKQKEVMEAGASLVEIDLTRLGQRVTVARPGLIPPQYRAVYQACVYRAWKPDYVAVYALRLARQLPTIPVPLRPTDKEVGLNLQALVETCYRNGRYDTIDYRAEPVPPLSQTDAAWSDALLRDSGRR